MGANAKLRVSFKWAVNPLACFDDGSTINAHTCIVKRKSLIAGDVALDMISAIAGLSALML